MNEKMLTFPYLKPRVLATDLDNTIVSDKVPHTELWETLALENTSLIYITGRYRQSAIDLIEREQLPKPDILICDVGASIYLGPSYELDQEWAGNIKQEDFEQVNAIAKSIDIARQPIDTPWRLAYFASKMQVQILKQAIKQHNLAVDLIFSSERDVDILPANINKGAALKYVLNKCQYDGEVVVAGDSENDLSLFNLGYPAIAVGNACDAILALSENEHIHYAKGHASAGVKEIWKKIYTPLSQKIQ